MENSSSSSGVIVGIVAIIAILAIAYFAVQMMQQKTPESGQPGIELNINGGTTSSGN